MSDYSQTFKSRVNVEVPKTGPLATDLFVVCEESHQQRSFGIFGGDSPFKSPFTLLLFQLSIVIIFTRIVRFLLKPFKQPRFISEIIGGIIIGPSVLGRNKKFSALIFPNGTEYIIKNIGLLGFMYFLFIAGVKMDMSLVIRSEKKQWYIAIIGVALPFLLVTVVALHQRSFMDKNLANISSLGALSSNLSITAFPVLYQIMKELNLLSSEVGRMALSTAIISDTIGITAIVVFEATKQAEVHMVAALCFLVSLVVLFGFISICLRRVMNWIVRRTPQGKPVAQPYVVAILLGVLVIGFITDMFGMAIANGPLWLGLVIPDGPPLGATLVERSETICMEILMPLAFTFLGLYTDVYAMCNAWSSLRPLLYMILTGFGSKLVFTLMAALFFDIPFRDGVAFSLVMNLRGQVEVMLYTHWIDKKIINIPSFTLLVLLTIALTATLTPLISTFYNPLIPYKINKRRTIQHSPTDSELRIAICIHDEDKVPGLINLIEISNPTYNSPFSIYALHLIELVGRAFPVMIDHDKEEIDSKYDGQSIHTIDRTLNMYQKTRGEFVRIHTFTAFSPKNSMYQDICKLALVKKVSLIILPFHREILDSFGRAESLSHGVQSVNRNVLAHAPCSVGIFVDKGHINENLLSKSSFASSPHHFAMLFLGGADAREALVYADRMAWNPNVYISLIRFLPHNYEGDNKMEKKLDDGIVTWFWVKNEAYKKVTYREIVVSNGEQTLEAIQAIDETSFDLWILGRKQGINPVLLQGLSDWSENFELGLIGDYIASDDFGSKGSVVVIQQQILREQGSVIGGSGL